LQDLKHHSDSCDRDDEHRSKGLSVWPPGLVIDEERHGTTTKSRGRAGDDSRPWCWTYGVGARDELVGIETGWRAWVANFESYGSGRGHSEEHIVKIYTFKARQSLRVWL